MCIAYMHNTYKAQGARAAERACVLRSGILPEGDRSGFLRCSSSELSDDDVQAVLSSLRSLPPVRSEVPDRQVTSPIDRDTGPGYRPAGWASR